MDSWHPLPLPGTPVIVGRDRERSGLGALLDQGRAGHGVLVLIGGQAGIGKTTLVRDMERRASERDMLVLSGQCYDLTVTPPYTPWVHIAHAAARIDGLPPGPATLRDDAALRQFHSQQSLFGELEDFVTALTAHQPVVLVLEDMHWSDPGSLEFLRSIGHGIAQLRLLIAVTYRDDEITREHPLYALLPQLVREAGAQRVNLRPLTDAAVRELVATRYTLTDADAARLVAYLQERAEGNPFFAEELLRTLEEEQILSPDAAAWSLGELGHQPVPPLVQQVIYGRVARLPLEVRAALEIAAVIGHDVPFDVWDAVARLHGIDVTIAIDYAVGAHVLADPRHGAQLHFTHALVREALYQALLLPRRRLLHVQVAEALMTTTGVTPDSIAHHLREAGDPRAIEWFMTAGIRAERIAWLTAAAHFEAALDLMREHESDPIERGWLIVRLARLLRFADAERTLAYVQEGLEYARATDDILLTAYLTFCRWEALGYLGIVKGRGDSQRGIAMLLGLSDDQRTRLDDLIARGVVVSDVVLIATLAAGIAHEGHMRTALQLGNEAIAAARQRGFVTPAEAPWGMAMSLALTGDPAAARRAFAEARELFRGLHDYVMAGSTAFMELVISVLAYDTENLAERARVISEGEECWTRARGAQGPWSPELMRLPALALEGVWAVARPQLLATRGLPMVAPRRFLCASLLVPIVHVQGDMALAWDLVRFVVPEGPSASPEEHFFLPALNTIHAAASLAMSQHDLDGARAWLETSDHWLNYRDVLLGRSESLRLWAAWYHATGDQEAAYGYARESLVIATTPRQPLAILRALRMLGELETERGQLDTAEQHLHEALLLADACVAPWERAQTLIALVKLRTATGAPNAARTLLQEARTICTHLAARPALARLDELERVLPPEVDTVPLPAGLSQREVEVLRLAAQGLTNAQIGEQLYLSPRTVEHHLRSIYRKLDVTTRAAATRYAVEHRLV